MQSDLDLVMRRDRTGRLFDNWFNCLEMPSDEGWSNCLMQEQSMAIIDAPTVAEVPPIAEEPLRQTGAMKVRFQLGLSG